ncbi:zinc finger protein GAI-ASSOCIATED FACTOR 1-like [Nymphaea colorata]|nr:zinc finger protein GAI-ASSOCIATED FACTOR 1-like [Nymphaea colorata]
MLVEAVEELEKSSTMTASNVTSASGEASVSSGGGNQNQNQEAPAPAAPAAPPPKRKRNLPGMPDPDAEVIALSPKTLMATNRFVCEICNKGFQRDQNLQLHRRGHNLPWKLRQRTSKEVKKRVYVCPETTCVHHDPARALGDLTGIKKHFCRKHGEKKWKCDKCSKKYAVQSDWKAHTKTCGTREYRCDCGTLFSRRDSFITHRAFCDALAEESAKAHTVVESAPAAPAVPATSSSEDTNNSKSKTGVAAAPAAQRVDSSNSALGAAPPPPASTPAAPLAAPHGPHLPTQQESGDSSGFLQPIVSNNGGGGNSIFAALMGSGGVHTQPQGFTDLIGAMARGERAASGCSTSTSSSSSLAPLALCLSSSASPVGPSTPASMAALFPPVAQSQNHHQFAPQPPHMSATALLQKAAQMGATSSSCSLFRGFSLASPSSSSSSALQQDQWVDSLQQPRTTAGLGLGLMSVPSLSYAGHNEDMGMPELMATSIFGSPVTIPKPTTLDFLGLGMGGAAPSGLSALITSMNGGNSGGLDMAAATSFGGGGGASRNGAGSSPGKSWDGS